MLFNSHSKLLCSRLLFVSFFRLWSKLIHIFATLCFIKSHIVAATQSKHALFFHSLLSTFSSIFCSLLKLWIHSSLNGNQNERTFFFFFLPAINEISKASGEDTPEIHGLANFWMHAWRVSTQMLVLTEPVHQLTKNYLAYPDAVKSSLHCFENIWSVPYIPFTHWGCQINGFYLKVSCQ